MSRQAIFQTRDATWLNFLVNRRDIKATFALHLSDAPIDFTELAGRDDYMILTNGLDAFTIWDRISPTVWQVHSVTDTSCRGRDAINAGKEFFSWIWDNTPTQVILGAAPVENKAARWLNRQIGMVSDGVAEHRGLFGSYDAEWFRAMRPCLDK